MNTNQIYTEVNSITAQALGSAAITAVDSGTFISLGNVVLSSTTYTSAWLDVLAQRIFRTIISERPYRNKMADMILTAEEFGAILQKIKIAMPEAIEDPAWNLQNGQSIDHYRVHKEQANQKFFTQRSPYLIEVTYPLFQLREAFLSPEAMGRYLSAKTQEVRNKIELISEDMAKTTIATAAGLAHGTSREVNLLVEFNTVTGLNLQTFNECMASEPFLRFAVSTINSYSDYLTEMSVLYNDGTATRHTPKTMQRLYTLADFDHALKANMQYGAFNPDMVSIGKHDTVGFWQSPASRYSIDIAANADAGIDAVSFDGLVAVLFDRDGLGVYHDMEVALTTPVNATGAYYNTAYHMRRQWLIDPSENFISFVVIPA